MVLVVPELIETLFVPIVKSSPANSIRPLLVAMLRFAVESTTLNVVFCPPAVMVMDEAFPPAPLSVPMFSTTLNVELLPAIVIVMLPVVC